MKKIWIILISVVSTIIIVAFLAVSTGTVVINKATNVYEINFKDEITTYRTLLSGLKKLLKDEFDYIIYGLLHVTWFQHWLVTLVENGVITKEFLDQFLIDNITVIIKNKWGNIFGFVGKTDKWIGITNNIQGLKVILSQLGFKVNSARASFPGIKNKWNSINSIIGDVTVGVGDLLVQKDVCTNDKNGSGGPLGLSGYVDYDKKGNGPVDNEVHIWDGKIKFDDPKCRLGPIQIIDDIKIEGASAEIIYDIFINRLGFIDPTP